MAVSDRRVSYWIECVLVLGPGVSSWQTRRLNSLNSVRKAQLIERCDGRVLAFGLRKPSSADTN